MWKAIRVERNSRVEFWGNLPSVRHASIWTCLDLKGYVWEIQRTAERHHLNSMQQIALLFRRLVSFSQFSELITSDLESADDKTHLTNKQTRITIQAYIYMEGPGQLSRYNDSLWAGRSGDRIPVEEIFRIYPDRTWGPPSLLQYGYRVFPGGEGGLGVTLTTHLLLVPRS